MALTRPFIALCLLAGMWLALTGAGTEHGEATDLELVLAVDVSKSMDNGELTVQRQGYAAAFRSPRVIGAITSGLHGHIAVLYLEWAGRGHAFTSIPWTRIGSAAAAHEFAERLESLDGEQIDRTSISHALLVSAEEIEANGWLGQRRVIDISGDGPNNQGEPVAPVRDLIVQAGIVINGLPLMINDGRRGFGIRDLDRYYEDCVTGGPGSFVIAVHEWGQFADAVERKLFTEIAGGLPYRIRLASADDESDCLVGERIWNDFRRRYNFGDD